MARPVCLITGVGPGTGASLARRFHSDYDIAMLARNAERLDALADALPNAYAYPCDVTDREALAETIARVRAERGEVEVLLHNAVGGAFGDVFAHDSSVLTRNFQINTVAFLELIQQLAPPMQAAGRGVILATGNTAATRGKAETAHFAPTKAAQRILAESAARRLGPDGIHVAYLLIDAVIDVEWTRKMMPDRPLEFFIQPDDIAETAWQVAHQPRSSWSFNVEVRPFGESW
jgi:short-subunit dehydrogenase